jgi:hypothetical protein
MRGEDVRWGELTSSSSEIHRFGFIKTLFESNQDLIPHVRKRFIQVNFDGL